MDICVETNTKLLFGFDKLFKALIIKNEQRVCHSGAGAYSGSGIMLEVCSQTPLTFVELLYALGEVMH